MNIPKGLSEALNRRRTDNGIAMWKKDNGTNKDVQNTTQKKSTTDEATRTR